MYIGILGGSFNPVHIGHIRLAIEALECKLLPKPLTRLDLIPCSIAPHKSNTSILPFSLRLAMLKAAVHDIDGLHINPLEQERTGPSYTWDTLTIYKQQYPNARLLFLVGGEDFSAIPQWFRGLELPQLADFAVVPRAGTDKKMFLDEIKRTWPTAKVTHDGPTPCARLEQGTYFYYLPLLRLDISSSYIRQQWCQGGNVRMLMPDAALGTLNMHKDEVLRYWKGENNHGTT